MQYNFLKIPKIDVWTIILACYLTNIFYFKGIEAPQKILVWVITVSYILLNINSLIRIVSPYIRTNRGKWFYIVFIIWLFFLFFTPLFSGSMDFSILDKFFSGVLWMLFMLSLLIRVKKKNSREFLFRSFAYIYVYALVIYILFTVLCVAIPSIYSFILEVVSVTEDSIRFVQDARYTMRVGWAGFSGFSVSIKCVIANCFMLNDISLHWINKVRCPVKKYILYLITLIGTLFYSRTGFVICALCLMGVVLYYGVKGYIGKSITIIIILGCIVFIGLPVITTAANKSTSIRWSFELILNIIEGRGVSTTSTDIMLRTMVIIPDKSSIVWGDGYYTSASGGYYMGTDIGVIRQLFYYGIVGTFFSYSMVIGALNGLTNVWNKKWNLLYFIFLLSFFVFELKGEPTVLMMPLFLCVSICLSFDQVNNVQ